MYNSLIVYIFCIMASINVKYFFTARLDSLMQFIRSHLGKLVLFCGLLVFGLVMGVLSSLKPVDPVEALCSVNEGMYGLIAQAAYAGYIFPLLLFTLISITVMCFAGRFAYSVILTAAFTVVLGFFQGATIVLVMRAFGVLALPLVIVYTVFSILTDLVCFALFAILADISAEKRKYGCPTPFLKVLRRSVFIAVACCLLVLVKFILVVLFSFFL